MRTKFVLHGGFAPSQIPEDNVFYAEVLKGTGDNPRILLVYFAKEEDRIPKNRVEDIAQFEKNRGGKKLVFEVANEKGFAEQVRRSDIVYFHGGRTAKILPVLARFPNLKEMFEGKIIAGDSAGANVLSAYFYGHHDKKAFEGLGLVPIKLFCHYSKDEGDKIQELNKFRSDMETVALSEYQTKVFEQV